MLSILNQRRTIRKYSDKPIASELINKLMKAAAQASNTGNMQTYSVIVTTDNEIKNKLAPTHFNQSMVKNAPVILTFCADFNRFSQWCKQRNAEPGYDNFQSFMAAAIDAIIFAQTFAVAAESEGLGICYLGTTTYNAGEIIDILNLPKLVVPVTAITVGYPDETPPLTDRLPLESVVHYENYADFTPEKIEELYTEKENSEFYKNFVIENNKETLAQVFTDVRYTKKNNEYFSEKFLNVLKQQGFL
ncbi:MAG: nitroreductase family protein [Paludibacter sp.]|nr:nitroreductase family protein [Paludibacter sp.]